MRDKELECVPLWRYCCVKSGDKRPYPDGWQNTPLKLEQITSSNIGILLGPVSQGLVALDFDGTTSWSWFGQSINCDIPSTVTWTSGKQDRCQMAFMVPEAYWAYLKTVKITNFKDDIISPGEGFEFRWTGAQSVLPPSSLADGRRYNWIAEPSRTDIAILPDAILSYWLQASNPEPRTIHTVKYPPATSREIEILAAELKRYYDQLDGYELWTSVCWAFCNTIGYADGIVLMRYYWPEKIAGEYDKLISRPAGGRQYGIGTIKWLIAQRNRDQYLANAAELAELDEILKIIQEKIKNGNQ